MKVVGVDPELALLLAKLEIEDQILHRDDDWMKEGFTYRDYAFYIAHFIIRGAPRTVIIRINEQDKRIEIHDCINGHIWSKDIDDNRKDIWVNAINKGELYEQKL